MIFCQYDLLKTVICVCIFYKLNDIRIFVRSVCPTGQQCVILVYGGRLLKSMCFGAAVCVVLSVDGRSLW